MERFLTDKALNGHWWDIPLLAVSGLFSAASISVLFDYIITPSPDRVLSVMAGLTVLACFSAPIWLYLRRRHRQKQAKAIAQCLDESNQSSMTYGALERRLGIHGARVRVAMLLAKGFLKEVYPDNAHGMLRFEGGPLAEPPAAPVIDTDNDDFNETLHQIRDLNDRIDHRGVSDRIDRIELLTGAIFKLITEHPDKAAETRRFISYYLPIAMKLLESYSMLEKQAYQGENIRASREQIEHVLDTIIKALERQEDRLFRSDALDVETDIKVLETLLAADGLTGPEHGLHL